jgi:hypothetical protein
MSERQNNGESVWCPHGDRLSANTCGPCSQGKPMRTDLPQLQFQCSCCDTWTDWQHEHLPPEHLRRGAGIKWLEVPHG